MTREEKLETIVKLFSKAMFYGDWKWETPNERVIQMLIEEVGYYPYKDEDDMITKSEVPEELYTLAIKAVPIRTLKDIKQRTNKEREVILHPTLKKQFTSEEIIGKEFALDLSSIPVQVEVIDVKNERVYVKYLSSYAGRVENFSINEFQHFAGIRII